MREDPREDSRVVYTIPPDGTGIVYQGHAHTQWVFVQYGREKGWAERQWVFVQYERAKGWVERGCVEEIVPRGGRF
jgi:hypothetical protein